MHVLCFCCSHSTVEPRPRSSQSLLCASRSPGAGQPWRSIGTSRHRGCRLGGLNFPTAMPSFPNVLGVALQQPLRPESPLKSPLRHSGTSSLRRRRSLSWSRAESAFDTAVCATFLSSAPHHPAFAVTSRALPTNRPLVRPPYSMLLPHEWLF